MYLILTDETNLQATEDVKFFCYGGLFLRFELISELDTAVRSIREKYGFRPEDDLKFNTKNRPAHIDIKTYTLAKNDVLDLCESKDCRFIAYVVHHEIAKGQQQDQRVTFAADHILKNFHDFLVEAKDSGLVFMDPIPINKPDAYLREKFQVGLKYPGKGEVKTLDRIHLYGTTGIGMSHLSSLIDIVLGSFRYCINNPQSETVAKTLFAKVLQLMWSQTIGDSEYVMDRGLILRPQEVKIPTYKRDYQALMESLKKFGKSDAGT